MTTPPQPADDAALGYDADLDTDGSGSRLDAYEERSATVMIGLAFAFLGLYALQVLWISAPPAWVSFLDVAQLVIWIVFLADFAFRIYLAERRFLYFATHPLDVITLLLPMFRPLRALRILAAARVMIDRGHYLAFGRLGVAIAGTAAFVGLVGALAVLDFERGAPESTINSFDESVWWAAITMTTVGYGDVYPVTPGGRLAAVAMMAVGISLLGVITASIAGWFTQRVRGSQEDTIDILTREIVDLRAELHQAQSPGNLDTDQSPQSPPSV